MGVAVAKTTVFSKKSFSMILLTIFTMFNQILLVHILANVHPPKASYDVRIKIQM